MSKLKILDCTLRDGGYYNDWDFTPELVQEYLKEMSLAGINKIELGLRNFPSEGFKGAFFYTTDDYIDSLNVPDGTDFGVMVDIQTIAVTEVNLSWFTIFGEHPVFLYSLAPIFTVAGEHKRLYVDFFRIFYVHSEIANPPT